MTAHAVHEHRPLGGRIITVPFLILCVLALIGGVLLAQRFLFGIGAVANVNDGYAWGIWVVIDVVVGTAFGCAGYAMALLVYILNRGEYHPLVRPALLASLFGYTLGGMAVVIDLGRYWNAYNLLLPGQINLRSVMFEISVCVAAYIIVLWIEFAPAFLERLGLKQPRKSLSRVLFLFIGLGVLLPTMHQSSLGTMLTVLGHRLDPLWQTQLLPLLFLISALVMGFAIVVFEAVLASVGFKRPAEAYILGKLSGLMAWLVVAYLVVRLVDLLARGAFGFAFQGTAAALMFWIENLLFLAAVLLLVPPANRSNPQRLFLGAAAMLLGGTVYRINAMLVGYHSATAGWTYFPSVSEIMVTVGIFAFEIILYLLFVKLLPVLPAVARR